MAKGCPICEKESAEKHKPFCSKRYADIDLGRWLKGNYALPSEENAPGIDGERPEDDGYS